MPVIRVQNLSKSYRLGQIGSSTLRDDLARSWAKLRKQPDPLLRIGQEDQANRQGESIWALKDVSFEVEQGEVLGIIGRNGAGKSTLLKILSRVTAPTSGVVKVKGRIASLLEVGTGFHPELTGRENIFLNGAILGMSREEVRRKFDEIVDFSGVEKFIDTPVKRYSSGMYVRLAFAVAAHLEPEILLVDEVLAVGDLEFQKKCLRKMDEVAHEGRTVLFVSHNMQVISSLCGEAILLRNGILSGRGIVSNIVQSYLESLFWQESSGTFCFTELGQKRLGTGSSRFEHMSFIGNSGKPQSIFQIGETFKILLKCRIIDVLPNQFYQVRIRSVNGSSIYHWVDFDDGLSSRTHAGLDTVSVELKNIRLFPGRYYVSIMVSDRYGTAFDHIEDAGVFDIESGSLVPMNRQYYPSLGIIHDIPRWIRLTEEELIFKK
jgi:lipopolysaccharide transport system ATP-binding protein